MNILQGLCQLSKTSDGQSVSYLALDIQDWGATEIEEDLEGYTHLRYINFSFNKLRSIQSLTFLPSVQRIDFQNNKLVKLDPFASPNSFPFLEYLDLSDNRIKSLGKIVAPNLEFLNLQKNAIETLEGFEGHPSLKILELRKNRITSMAGLNDLPSLEELYMAENRIQALESLEYAPNLRILHLRKNKICKIDDAKPPSLPSLEYLNIRMNDLTKTPSLNLLKECTKLRRITSINCPLIPEPSGSIRTELLIIFPWLEVINKYTIRESDRLAAENEMLNRAINAAAEPEQEEGEVEKKEEKKVDPFEDDDDWW